MAVISDTQVAILSKAKPKEGEYRKVAEQLGMYTDETDVALASRVKDYEAKTTTQGGTIAKSAQESSKK